jgi:hypothetical protein
MIRATVVALVLGVKMRTLLVVLLACGLTKAHDIIIVVKEPPPKIVAISPPPPPIILPAEIRFVPLREAPPRKYAQPMPKRRFFFGLSFGRE